MSSEARERLLQYVSFNDAANEGVTPDQLVNDAISEALLNQPALRNCLIPGCFKQMDAISCMNGHKPPRPEWSGQGWRTLGSGTIFPAGGHICPDHVETVTDHLPRRLKLPSGRWSVECACSWTPTPQRWHGILRSMWEQHILTVTGKLPDAPPVTDPEHRTPLSDLTEADLADLYDRLWDAETDREETRQVARTCMTYYTSAVPALLGVQTSLEALRSRIVTDSRDWSSDKLDAWLWAVLVGLNCENTEAGHVHDDDCAGDQGLWDMARQHGIPTDQAIRTGQLRWWVANAIKVAKQIEEANPQ
ncbi:hypothetical protein [Streptomyces zhihengii]